LIKCPKFFSSLQELGINGQVSRIEAAELCSTKFAREHARARPQDVFSVVTFHEFASVVCCKASSSEMATLAFEDRAANGTFYLQALISAARLLLQASPELQGDAQEDIMFQRKEGNIMYL